MERYTALKQDDGLYDEPLDDQIRAGPRRTLSPYLWFAAGFFAALATTLIFALTSAVATRQVAPPGLIPDCKAGVRTLNRIAAYNSVVPKVDVMFEPHAEFSNLTDPVSTRLWHDMRKFSLKSSRGTVS
jgi:hypothetical protein